MNRFEIIEDLIYYKLFYELYMNDIFNITCMPSHINGVKQIKLRAIE